MQRLWGAICSELSNLIKRPRSRCTPENALSACMIGKNGCNIARRCALFRAGIFALLLRTTLSFGQQSVPDSIAVSPQPLAPESASSATSVDANTDATLAAPETSSASVQADPRETGYSSVPRRFHYNLDLTLRAGSDDNINLSHTDRQSDYFLCDRSDTNAWVRRFRYAPREFPARRFCAELGWLCQSR